MPYKSTFPPLPYLDPKLNPDHPLNHIEIVDEFPRLPMRKRERRRREQEALAEAMKTYNPPHVIRSWEADPAKSATRSKILGLILPPKMLNDFDDLVSKDKSVPEKTNFRSFAVLHLHLGYNRFHATHGEPHFESEEDDPALPPEDICWIMEYTENECNIIRRQIAWELGEFPAVFDQSSPLYDEELEWRYNRRLYCRCRRRNRRCIRPSHIEIFTSIGDILP